MLLPKKILVGISRADATRVRVAAAMALLQRAPNAAPCSASCPPPAQHLAPAVFSRQHRTAPSISCKPRTDEGIIMRPGWALSAVAVAAPAAPPVGSGQPSLLHSFGEVGDVPPAHLPWLLRLAHVKSRVQGGDSKAALQVGMVAPITHRTAPSRAVACPTPHRRPPSRAVACPPPLTEERPPPLPPPGRAPSRAVACPPPLTEECPPPPPSPGRAPSQAVACPPPPHPLGPALPLKQDNAPSGCSMHAPAGERPRVHGLAGRPRQGPVAG